MQALSRTPTEDECRNHLQSWNRACRVRDRIEILTTHWAVRWPDRWSGGYRQGELIASQKAGPGDRPGALMDAIGGSNQVVAPVITSLCRAASIACLTPWTVSGSAAATSCVISTSAPVGVVARACWPFGGRDKNKMSIPGFTAESSVFRSGCFRSTQLFPTGSTNESRVVVPARSTHQICLPIVKCSSTGCWVVPCGIVIVVPGGSVGHL